MKLLLDENLSVRLLDLIGDLFPDSLHVQQAGLVNTADRLIWAYAKEHGLAILTKDLDFARRSRSHSHPPRVIWVRTGNVRNHVISSLMRAEYAAIVEFLNQEQHSCLLLESGAVKPLRAG